MVDFFLEALFSAYTKTCWEISCWVQGKCMMSDEQQLATLSGMSMYLFFWLALAWILC